MASRLSTIHFKGNSSIIKKTEFIQIQFLEPMSNARSLTKAAKPAF